MTSDQSDDHLGRVLSGYEIGRKIHALRLRKKLGLVDLGKHTGLSASMLSQLENGKLIPTLPTLARISMVFDVGLDHFFADKNRRKLMLVVRRRERIKFPDRPDNPQPNYLFECLAFSSQEKSLQAYLAEFPCRERDSITMHVHEGAEFIHVLEGMLTVTFHDEDYDLGMGDSAYFDASEPHGYRGSVPEITRALIVTTPPRL